MVTTVEARPREEILTGLYKLTQSFKDSQESVAKRMDDIRTGHVTIERNGKRRVPIKFLLGRRDQARANLSEFLNGLNDDEVNMITIVQADLNWRDYYNDMLDPRKDPKL